MELIYNLNIYLMPILTIPLYFTFMDKYRENYLWHLLLLLFTISYFILVFTGIYGITKYILVLGQMFFLGWGASFRFSLKLTDELDNRNRIPYIFNILFGVFYWIISSLIFINIKFNFVEYLFDGKWIVQLLNFSYSQEYILINLTPFVNFLSIFALIYCLYLTIYSFIVFVRKSEILLKYQLIPLIPTLFLSYLLLFLVK